MPTSELMKCDVNGKVYRFRDFVPKRIKDGYNRIVADGEKSNVDKSQEANDYLLQEMSLKPLEEDKGVHPKLTKEFLQSDDCNSKVTEALTYWLLKEHDMLGFDEEDLIDVDLEDKNELMRLHMKRQNELKKKVHRL